MKGVLTVVTFVMGALCFVVFLTTVKPQAVGVAFSPGKLVHGIGTGR